MTAATLPGPYRATKFDDFVNDNAWLKEAEGFIIIGLTKDKDDPKNAKMSVANSEISRELMSLMTIAMMYHHNLKTDSQEILIISKDGS